MPNKDLEILFNSFVDNFMTGKDIALLLNVKERTIWQYKSNGKLPRPFGFLDNKPIWSKIDIQNWIKEENLSQAVNIIIYK
jgi:predicted DNA-binding transcriptional regulator AlpA